MGFLRIVKPYCECDAGADALNDPYDLVQFDGTDYWDLINDKVDENELVQVKL